MTDWVQKQMERIHAEEAAEGQKGGPGSGHWGHAGRPGKRGGSLPGSVAVSIRTGETARERQQAAASGGGQLAEMAALRKQENDLNGKILDIVDKINANQPLEGYYKPSENKRRIRQNAEWEQEIGQLEAERGRVQARMTKLDYEQQHSPDAEIRRLMSGKLQEGDFVWSTEPGMGGVGGQIIGRGKVAKRGSDYWRVRNTRGDEYFIPVGKAVAGGIVGATPG